MIFVIFGAGASFGSVADEDIAEDADRDLRPPLTQELFANRESLRRILRKYPECVPLLPRLRPLESTRGGYLFERELSAIQDEAASYPERARQLAAVTFYLRDALKACTTEWTRMSNGATNYAGLLDALRFHQHVADEPIRLVTFNYDLLLERAVARTFNYKFEAIDDYVRRDDLRIYRPHGAINWVHPIANAEMLRKNRIERKHLSLGLLRNERIYYAPDLVPAPHIEVAGQQYLEEWTLPAMAIPLEGKDSFECPPEHIEKLREDVKQASVVITVGWRGMESKFNEIFRDLPFDTPVQVVSSKMVEAFKVSMILRDQGWPIRTMPSVSEGFAHYVHTNQIRAALHAETRELLALTRADEKRELRALVEQACRDRLHGSGVALNAGSLKVFADQYMENEWPKV